MKTLHSIPAAVALLFILCAPFSSLPICNSSTNGGLVCYCCSAEHGKCPRISCSCPGCNATSGAETAPRWSPEMILDSIYAIRYAHHVSYEAVSFPAPGVVYIEVTVKPTNPT